MSFSDVLVFRVNFKRELRKRKIKITDFAPNVLGLSIQTLTNKLNKGNLSFSDIRKIENTLRIRYSDLCTPIEGYSYIDKRSSKYKKRKAKGNAKDEKKPTEVKGVETKEIKSKYDRLMNL